ncbi:MAG: hypothetical protein RLY14_946 [Planctomycetota bacterium]
MTGLERSNPSTQNGLEAFPKIATPEVEPKPDLRAGDGLGVSEKLAVRAEGLEPSTHGLKVRCSTD